MQLVTGIKCLCHRQHRVHFARHSALAPSSYNQFCWKPEVGHAREVVTMNGCHCIYRPAGEAGDTSFDVEINEVIFLPTLCH